MTDARDRILARLRAASPARPSPDPRPPVRGFDWDRQTCLERFEQALVSMHGQMHRVGPDWPARLAELLRRRGADNLYYGPAGPHGGVLEAGWPADGPRLVAGDRSIDTLRGELFETAAAGFTSCRAGIAETGSLVLWPTSAEPRLLSLVPPIHCALLGVEQLVSTLHALIADAGWSAGMPTNALLVTGPSKSADIEQTLTYGVHGPRELIVLLR